MLIADGNDLNPKMLVRWQAFLTQTRKAKDPVVRPLARGSPTCRTRSSPRKAPAVAAALATGGGERGRRPARSGEPAEVDGRRRRTLRGPAVRGRGAGRSDRRCGRRRRTAAGATRPRRSSELPPAVHGPDATVDRRRTTATSPAARPRRRRRSCRSSARPWSSGGRTARAPPRAMALDDAPDAVEPRVFLRGNPYNLGRGGPAAVPHGASPAPDRKPFRDGSGRLELARAIADPNNPLTARVLVNRVWMHHFGTRPGRHARRLRPPQRPADAPRAARPPGRRFIDDGWSLKAAPPADHALRRPISSERRPRRAAEASTPRTRCSGG